MVAARIRACEAVKALLSTSTRGSSGWSTSSVSHSESANVTPMRDPFLLLIDTSVVRWVTVDVRLSVIRLLGTAPPRAAKARHRRAGHEDARPAAHCRREEPGQDVRCGGPHTCGRR